MFSFDNINKVIEGRAMTDTTPITRLDDELTQKVLTATYTLGMSDRLTSVVKNMIAKMGIIKDHADEVIAVNAICFFNSPVKGIGALLNDPEFRIYELDVSSANVILTDYVAGGIIRRDRDIVGYNKSRQFHKDDIECIVPINSRGAIEYQNCDQYIMNLVNTEEKSIDKLLRDVFNSPTKLKEYDAAKVDEVTNTVDDTPLESKAMTGTVFASEHVTASFTDKCNNNDNSKTSDDNPWVVGKTFTGEKK